MASDNQSGANQSSTTNPGTSNSDEQKQIPRQQPEDENQFRKKYKQEALALLNYKDPIPFPFISSLGEGSDKITVLPSPHIRVFIMGYEVSAWISLATWGGESTPAQLNSPNNITIKCPRDLFTLTQDNVFLNSWNLNDDFRTSEQVKKALYDWKKDKNVYEEKTLLGTWSLTVNTCILHTSDTVRIFAHIPWTEDDAWLPVFNGYINNVNISTDMLNGIDTISIDLETIANKLTTARFLNNPYSRQILNQGSKVVRPPSDTIQAPLLDPENRSITDEAARRIVTNLTLYKDVVNPTLYQSILTNTTLDRVLSFLFYGDIELGYRSEISANNSSLKDLSIRYEDFIFGDADKTEFLKAFSSNSQIIENNKPTLGQVIALIETFNKEKLLNEEKNKLEKTFKIENIDSTTLTIPGGPLYNAADSFLDNKWNKTKKYNSLIWKLQIMTHVVNKTLTEKSTAPKQNLDNAAIVLTIGNKYKEGFSTALAPVIEKQNIITDVKINREGFGYTYDQFGKKPTDTETTVTVSINPPQVNNKSLYTFEQTKSLRAPKSGELETKEGTLLIKLENGKITEAKVAKVAVNGKEEFASGENYYTDSKDKTITLNFFNPTNSIEKQENFIDPKTFQFSTVFKDRYNDFLYKRGWGYLDPRLFSYHRVEFPRTGYPDAELDALTKAAVIKEISKNIPKRLNSIDVKYKLKKALGNQLVLKEFLTKMGMKKIGVKLEEKTLTVAAKTNYAYDGTQIIDALQANYQDIGIPLAAYTKNGQSVDQWIRLYQSRDWYDEHKSLFEVINLRTNSDYTFKVEPAQQKFLPTEEEKTVDGTYFTLEKGKRFELSSKELTDKFNRAVYIDLVGKGVYVSLIDQGRSSLYPVLSYSDNIESNAKNILTLSMPSIYNITNNTVVIGEDPNGIDAAQNIYFIVKEIVELYKNKNIKELVESIDPENAGKFIKIFTQLKMKESNLEDSAASNAVQNITFGGASGFTVPFTSIKMAAGNFNNKSIAEYSYDWANGIGSKMTAINNPPETNMRNIANPPKFEEPGFNVDQQTQSLVLTGGGIGFALGAFPGAIAGAGLGWLLGNLKELVARARNTIIEIKNFSDGISEDQKFNDKTSKFCYQERLRTLSNSVLINKGGKISGGFYYDYLDTNTNFYAIGVYVETQNIIPGPVFTFSISRPQIYHIKPNDYTETKDKIPPSFMAWAVLAYQYYESQTGVTQGELTNLVNNVLTSSIIMDRVKSLTPKALGEPLALNQLYVVQPANYITTYNPILPKFEVAWYETWKKIADTKIKEKEKPGSTLQKLPDLIQEYSDANKNLIKNTTDVKNGQYIYKYVNPQLKTLCINKINETDKPYNIFKIIDAYGPLENPTVSLINDRIQGNSKSSPVIPPGDPNSDEPKQKQIVNFFAPEESTFDVVAPIEGIVQYTKEGLLQFSALGGTEGNDDTVHEFNFLPKEAKTIKEVLQNLNITNLDNLHWTKVKECGIYNEVKDVKTGEVTKAPIKDFLRDAKKAGITVGEGINTLANRTLKRLGALEPDVANAWKNTPEIAYSSGSPNDTELSSIFADNVALKKILNKGGIAVLGQIPNVLVDSEVLFRSLKNNSSANINEFNKIKYDTLRIKYINIQTLATQIQTWLNTKPGTVDKNTASTLPLGIPAGFKVVEPVVAPYTYAASYADYVFYLKYNTGWTISVVQDIEGTTTDLEIADTNTLKDFIVNLGTIITGCNTILTGINKNLDVTNGTATKFYKKIKKLEAWYETNTDDGLTKYGTLIDSQVAAIESNTSYPLDPNNARNKNIRVEKGGILVKGVTSVTWSIYKKISSVPDLDPSLLYESDEEKFKLNSTLFSLISPWAWLNDSLGNKDANGQSNFINRKIDWAYEEYFMADWHRKCVVGFSNGIPISSLNIDGTKIYKDEVNGIQADAVDCAKAATARLNSWLTYDEVTIIGKNSGWEGIYSPHGKTVTVALRSPKYGWGINGGTEKLLFQSFDYESGTESKADILTRLMGRLDYHWWINGNGDVIVDFPHYELIPSHYGPKWESFFQLQNLSSSVTYTENFKMLASLYYYKGGYGIKPGSDDNQIKAYVSAVFHLPNVMVRNGIIPVTETFQWITDRERLKRFGLIQLKKKVLNSYTIVMSDLPPILYMTPNTPVYMADRDVFGLVSSVRFNWTISDSAVTYRLTPQLTAIKQRLNYEQLALEQYAKNRNDKEKIKQIDENRYQVSFKDFIRPVYSNTTKRIEAETFYLSDQIKSTSESSGKTNNPIIIKSNEVLGFIQNPYAGVVLNPEEIGLDTLVSQNLRYPENERLNQIQSNYGYIYGNKEPILDYTSTFTQNEYVMGTKWQVLQNDDPNSTYEVLTDVKNGKDLVADTLNELNTKTKLNPVSGQLADSLDAAGKVLGMSQNNLKVWKDAGINPDNTQLGDAVATQLNALPKDGMTEKVAAATALINTLIDRLKSKYRVTIQESNLNPVLTFCLGNFNGYETKDINPAVLATCGLLEYTNSKSVTINFIESESYTDIKDSAPKAVATIIKNNLNSYLQLHKDQASAIQEDLAKLDEWSKNLIQGAEIKDRTPVENQGDSEVEQEYIPWHDRLSI